ncbi:MAG: NUDIX domain-containing protein [bacterium]|nr:NUDIX domain-containing protein [bacterium]
MAECKIVIDVAIISKENILLVKYRDKNKYDHQKGWFIPDDLLAQSEHPDDAAIRILSEQFNINLCPKIDHFESFTGNDNSWHLIFHYKAEADELPEVKPSEDIETFQWFGLNDLPGESEVAHHGWALFTIDEMMKLKK